MKKAIVWDLDGTILNTLDDLEKSVNYALDKYAFPKHSTAEIKMMLGNGIRALMIAAIPDGENNSMFEECFEAFKLYYQEHMNDSTCPYDGIAEVMTVLNKKGYKQAIVSNKIDDAVQYLAKTYYPLVDIALGECAGISRKPHPEMIEIVLDKLGIQKNDAVYIGDSEVDLETARNAGLDCISVAWGFRSKDMLREIGAKIIVNTPNEIVKVLEKM